MDPSVVFIFGDMAIIAGGDKMPRGDRRGPNEKGPVTGKGTGFCNGFSAPGYLNTGDPGAPGRGFRGRPMGAGYGRGYGSYSATVPFAGYTKEAEADYLENEISFLKDRLKTIEVRLAEKKAVKE